MRTLILYIDNHLDRPINWTLNEDGQEIDKGSSNFDEFTGFENVQVEIYLNAQCCSIFQTDKIAGISTNRLTDQLILGLLEEDLVDDIEDVKPIMMRLEDDLAYIAIFNRDFYDQLLLKLINLDKPIKLLQSFVYSTTINENRSEWVLYLSNEQNFVRTSNFQYFLLDDAKPLPMLLEEMLSNTQKPDYIVVYSNTDYDLSLLVSKYDIKVENAPEPLQFGNLAWNFYNQKSSSFKIKLDNRAKFNLIKLINVFKYFASIMIVLWLINLISVIVDKHHLENELKENLSKIGKIDTIDPNSLTKLNDQLTKAVHDRGLRDDQDFSPMFVLLLKDIPAINSNDITQVEFDSASNVLVVYLRNFDTKQYDSYRDVFRSQHIVTDLTEYKSYVKDHKKENSRDLDGSNTDQPISSDTQWVLTLKSVWVFQATTVKE